MSDKHHAVLLKASRFIGMLLCLCCLQSKAHAETVLPLLLAETRDENGEIAPIRPENQKIIAYFERAMDVKFEVRRYPLPRVIENIGKGEGLGFGLSKNTERLKTMRYSEAVFSDFVWVVARDDTHMKYAGISDLQGKSVGIVRGIRFGDDIDKLRNVMFRVEEDQPQNSSRLKKLLSGRMDVMLVNSRMPNAKDLEAELNLYLDEKNLRNETQMNYGVKVFAKPLLVDPIHFTTGANTRLDVINKINAAIIKGRKSGDLPTLWKN
ncbi:MULTISPECIES: substrate-binding periplasmic protein [unclassified Undibacterium]|uniref:substrate-binding periplasmic protein n=1 Tax=unclassified Undibacterium TaxID=2630295 RepID=UPI00138A4B0A|nr:transporter substrate-binding domain-containing protein [Undibacterium sp. KW1]